MANNKFKAAVKKAKGLYRTGRYKTFADAVKAAYKKNKSTGTTRKKRRVSATKFIERGETKRTPATVYRRVRTKQGLFRGSQKVSGFVSAKKQVENSLGKALVDHYKATTIRATKAASKRISGLKKKLRSL